MRKPMKKGFLFSLMTFMLLFSILIFSSDYLNRSKQLQNSLADSRTSSKIVYLWDDLTNGALEGLTNISVLDIKRAEPNLTINFTGGIIGAGDYGAATLLYADFISHNYSVLSNVEINMTGFNAGFYVSPFGISYALGIDNCSLTTINHSLLKKISLAIRLNISKSHLSQNNTPVDDSGGREIKVEVYDTAGLILLDDTTAYLNPVEENEPFLLAFDGGQGLEVRFGDYLGMPGSLLINATGLAASVSWIEVTYNYTSEPVEISDGNLRLYSPLGRLEKQGTIVLKRG